MFRVLGRVCTSRRRTLPAIAFATGDHEIKCFGDTTFRKGLDVIDDDTEMIQEWGVPPRPARMTAGNGHGMTLGSNEGL